MTAPSPEFRLQQIKTRRLEIAATLSEWKRAYFVDGISRPLEDRLTLEAENAQLALERRSIEDAAFKAKLARQDGARQTLVHQLVAVLKERGLDDVIAEAQLRADQAKPQDAALHAEKEAEEASRIDAMHAHMAAVEAAKIAARCPRCMGEGRIAQFQNIKGGSCFQCGGSGVFSRYKG